MRYLLDTHALLWYLSNNTDRMPQRVFEKISSEKQVAVSCVSLWEVAIKKGLGKLDFNYSLQDVEKMCRTSNISIIPMKAKVMDDITILPDIHRDPFDRYIISTGRTENMTIITTDGNIPQYDVQTFWS